MRATYVPLFQDIRQSSLWAHDSDIRIVWVTLLTLVDPEGFVCAAVPGLAVTANVHIDKVREAIKLFESPDPDSRSEAHEGRRIERVPRGWRVLNFPAMLERAKHEAEKARQRRYINARRSAERERERAECTVLPPEAYGFVGVVSPPVYDPSTHQDQDQDLNPLPKKEGIPPTPVEAQGMPTVWRTLDGWTPSPELVQQSAIAGLTAEEFFRRVDELRLGPIGGSRGVLDRDGYVRSQLGKWRTWGEADRVRAKQAAAPPSSRYAVRSPTLEPTDKHRRYAKAKGVDLSAVLKGIDEEGLVESLGLGRAKEILGERLSKAAAAANDSKRQAS
jgi:hypothetical protein